MKVDARIGILALTLLPLACGKAESPQPSSAASRPDTSKSWACVQAAEKASASLLEAAALVGRPPVDASAWSSAESAASSALSSAESACGSEPADQEVKGALSTMRSMLADLGNAARGTGGAVDLARQQESIDSQLDKARSMLK